MSNNALIRILIPVVAVVVIFESIVMVSNLENNSKDLQENNETTQDVIKVEKPKQKAVGAMELTLSAESKEMLIGKKYKVLLDITPGDNFNISTLDLYIKYNPELFSVSGLNTTKDLAKPDFLKVNEKKGIVAVNYLFNNSNGINFVKAKNVELLTFFVVPKKIGLTYFEISTGDSEGTSVTMFVDKVTSKGLPFSSNKLEINLIDLK